MQEQSLEERERRRVRLQNQVKELFQIEDMSGIEVFSSMARITRLLEVLEARQDEDGQSLSGPRWRLLMHLFISEQMGKKEGITPTELSHFQQVSKNTISSLLRGLEDQGYIDRRMDPSDLRVFRIHLSDAGRQAILDMAPRRIHKLNGLLQGLSEEEVKDLRALLVKLLGSLERQVCKADEA